MSSSQLSEVIGLKPRRIQELVQEGVIPAETRNKRLRFDLAEACKAYIDHLRAEATRKAPDEEELAKQKLQADVDFRRAKADQAEMELKELKGMLHRSEDVEDALNGLVYEVRAMLNALPSRLATVVRECKTDAEAAEAIKREKNRMLLDLAQYEYDPKFFKAKVRERQGWSEPS